MIVNGFVVCHPTAVQGPKSSEYGDVVTDQLQQVGCFYDGSTRNADIQPTGYELIKQFFLVDHGDQQKHTVLPTSKQQHLRFQ